MLRQRRNNNQNQENQNKTSLQHHTSNKFDIVTVNNANAVVIIFGWLGAKQRHVNKYASMYHNENNNNNNSVNDNDNNNVTDESQQLLLRCSTVTGVLDPMSLMTNNTKKMKHFVMDALKEAAILIRIAEEEHQQQFKTKKMKQIPLFIHVFSNGGCFPLEQLEIELYKNINNNSNSNESCSNMNTSASSSKKEEDETTKTTTEEEEEDIKLLKFMYNHLQIGGEIFDSCPAYLYISSGLNAIGSSLPRNNHLLRLLLQCMFISYCLYQTFIFYVYNYCIVTIVSSSSSSSTSSSNSKKNKRKIVNRVDEYWYNMKHSTICTNQAYIYSVSDKLTDYTKLNELINYRRTTTTSSSSSSSSSTCSKNKNNISILKFTNTKHCQHYLSHPDEYYNFIKDFILNSTKNNEK